MEASVDCKERFYFLKTQRKEKEKRGEEGRGGEKRGGEDVQCLDECITLYEWTHKHYVPVVLLSQAGWGTSTYLHSNTQGVK